MTDIVEAAQRYHRISGWIALKRLLLFFITDVVLFFIRSLSRLGVFFLLLLMSVRDARRGCETQLGLDVYQIIVQCHELLVCCYSPDRIDTVSVRMTTAIDWSIRNLVWKSNLVVRCAMLRCGNLLACWIIGKAFRCVFAIVAEWTFRLQCHWHHCRNLIVHTWNRTRNLFESSPSGFDVKLKFHFLPWCFRDEVIKADGRCCHYWLAARKAFYFLVQHFSIRFSVARDSKPIN